jgi:hypothetical protein
VYESDELLFVSPTDLTKYLGCRHATHLDLTVARGQLGKPGSGISETLEALFTRGVEHEAAYQPAGRGLRGVDGTGAAGADRAEGR